MPILASETSQYPEDLLSETFDEQKSRKWWVVYTKARQEKAFARQLLAQEVPFYLPLVAKENRIRGRRVLSHIPVFGGYAFMYVDADERVLGLKTNRVSRILEVDDQMRLVSDLRNVARLIASNAPLTVESRLGPGRRVRVKSGAMAGVEGTVEARRGHQRLLVAVTFLQQGVSVDIEDFLLEPID